MADSKSETPTNNDVSPPGKTPPSKTSKPVIITHHAMLNDPMVVAPKAETMPEAGGDKPQLAKAVTPIKIRPLAEKPASEAAPKAPEATTELAKVEAESKPEPIKAEATTPPKPSEPAKPVTAAEASKTPVPTPSSDQPSEPPSDKILNPESDGDVQAQAGTPTDPAALEAEEAERAKHAAEIQKLADSKKYYLPINAVEKRRSKRALIILIVFVVLAAVWADVASDAGMLTIPGVKPVTNFFPDK